MELIQDISIVVNEEINMIESKKDLIRERIQNMYSELLMLNNKQDQIKKEILSIFNKD